MTDEDTPRSGSPADVSAAERMLGWATVAATTLGAICLAWTMLAPGAGVGSRVIATVSYVALPVAVLCLAATIGLNAVRRARASRRGGDR